MNDTEKEGLVSAEQAVTKTDVFDNQTQPELSLESACQIAIAAAKQISSHTPQFEPRSARMITRAFEHTLIPGKGPGRKKQQRITAAYEDWKQGMRGAALYRKHIPCYVQMNRYHRASAIRALASAIRNRERRVKEPTAL